MQARDTKAANLRLESRAYSLLHYVSAVLRRSKADIVEQALYEYVANHREELVARSSDVAAAAGLNLARFFRAPRGKIHASREPSRGKPLAHAR